MSEHLSNCRPPPGSVLLADRDMTKGTALCLTSPTTGVNKGQLAPLGKDN